jgi:predicted neuraminidase
MSIFTAPQAGAAESEPGPKPEGLSHAVAVKDCTAWPNLDELADGAVVATIFNQPCHGLWEGDVDCWATTDGGKSWSPPQRIAGFDGDGGHPATVELSDGRLLTTFYAKRTADHEGYQMATVTWPLPPNQ